MKKNAVEFFYAVLAGMMIGVGGTVFLSNENRVIGSLLFSIGLIVILHFGFRLYTGMIGYLVNNQPDYLRNCLWVWAGNFLGTFLLGTALRYTRTGYALAEKALPVCQVKLNDNLLSIFILALLCGMLMYIAVESYKNVLHSAGKYLSVILCVSVFILCGFEHCVANMFYFSLARLWNFQTFLYLIVMTLGNTAGATLIAFGVKLKSS